MKIILIPFTFFAFTISATAQKVDQKNVPSAVTTALKTTCHVSQPVHWTKEDGNFEAEFVKNGIETSYVLDPQGKLLETENEIAVSALPQPVKDACAKDFPSRKIKEAAKITDSAGHVKYEAHVDGKDFFYDESGKAIAK